MAERLLFVDLENVQKIDLSAVPVDGLAGKVKSWFPQLPEDERLALVQQLFDKGYVRESEKQLAYDLAGDATP